MKIPGKIISIIKQLFGINKSMTHHVIHDGKIKRLDCNAWFIIVLTFALFIVVMIKLVSMME